MHTYVHASIYAHIYTCIHTGIHVYAYVHACIHMCIHANLRIYMQTYIHTWTHTYTHTSTWDTRIDWQTNKQYWKRNEKKRPSTLCPFTISVFAQTSCSFRFCSTRHLPSWANIQGDPGTLLRLLAWIRGLRDVAKITAQNTLHVRDLLGVGSGWKRKRAVFQDLGRIRVHYLCPQWKCVTFV